MLVARYVGRLAVIALVNKVFSGGIFGCACVRLVLHFDLHLHPRQLLMLRLLPARFVFSIFTAGKPVLR